MINFFRNIRRKLANENKFQRYFRYAFGEVALIMIGIFMALQLNNWNEKRKQETRFKETLDQLYTTTKYDAEHYYRQSVMFRNQVDLLDILLEQPDSITPTDLPFELYLLCFNAETLNSESTSFIKDLTYNNENLKQKELAKELINYGNNIQSILFRVDDNLKDILVNNSIAFPKIDINNVNAGWGSTDSSYYNEADITKLTNFLKDHHFRSILKSLRSNKTYHFAKAKNAENDALSIRELIKMFYPNVKVFYKDVGIIGTAINGFDDVGAKSTPMTLINEDESIWEVILFLKEGRVKFRCRDSWAQNWGVRGEMEFPKGHAVQDGRDIPIPEAGNYRVVLNLTANTYEFIKLAD